MTSAVRPTLVATLLLTFLLVPSAAAVDQPADGVTALITIDGSLGDTVLLSEDGTYTVQVTIFRDVASEWTQVRMGATLRVFEDSLDGGIDRVSKYFFSSEAAPVAITFSADTFTGGPLDLFVTFSSLGGSPVPTSHHNLVKNAALAESDYATADSLDHHSTRVVAAGAVPEIPEIPELPTVPQGNGVTAKITFPDSVGDQVLVATNGYYRAHVSIYDNTGGTWGQVAMFATLRVFEHNSLWALDDRLSISFTSSADEPVEVLIPEEALASRALDVFVTFSGRGGSPTPTSHHSVVKNAALEAGLFDLADQLDAQGTRAFLAPREAPTPALPFR